MTKILVFSDHHAHNFNFGSERKLGKVCGREGYYNSRFLASLDILNEVKELAKTRDLVLFGGDLFHQRQSVSTDVLLGTYEVIEEIGYYSNFHMIPGNHDYQDRVGNIHSLLGLRKVTITDRPQSITIDNVRIYKIPYCEDKQVFLEALHSFEKDFDKTKFNLLLCHQGVQGGVVGSDYVLSSENDLALDEIPECFNLVLIGHFHKHQKLKDNVFFIGSSHQHNWGDANDTRGFLDVEIHKDMSYSISQIESQSAPRFIITDTPTKVRDMDFVKATSSKLSSTDFGNPKVFENITVEEEEQEEFSTPSFSIENLLTAWVENKKATQFLQLGKDIIKEAQDAK